MATVKVRYFVTKRRADGSVRHYWQPKKELRALGWQTRRLADDRARAVAEAEAINLQLDAWRKGEEAARDKALAAGCVAELILRYQASRHYTTKRATTKRGYKQNLDIIDAWIGTTPIAAVTPRMVQDFYETLLPKTPAKANAVIRMTRILFNYALRQGDVSRNPAEKPGLIGRPARRGLWTFDALDICVAAADQAGRPSIGTALLLGGLLGQRQGDLLALKWNAYRDGAFHLRTRKTDAPVAVPATDELRDRLAAMTAEPVANLHILINENTGRPYGGGAHTFRHDFLAIRRAAAADCPALDDLWYMDLRRTCVVWMIEGGATAEWVSAVTGHTLKSVYQIIETYMPRTPHMAAKAIERLDARRAEHRAKQARERRSRGEA